MAVPASSLRPQRFPLLRLPRRALRRLPLEPLRERVEGYVGDWGSPLRFVAVAALCGGLALVVTLVVLALAVTSSPLWIAMLLPCIAGWVGLYNEFSGRRRARVEKALAELAALEALEAAKAKPARKTPTRRKTAAAKETPAVAVAAAAEPQAKPAQPTPAQPTPA
jgi:hypothetical protein